jgi:2-haloacid dehalogenase
MQNVKALLFDVFGTLVDWRSGSPARAICLARHRIDWNAFADAGAIRIPTGHGRVRRGFALQQIDTLHRRNLDVILNSLASATSAIGIVGLNLAASARAWLM